MPDPLSQKLGLSENSASDSFEQSLIRYHLNHAIHRYGYRTVRDYVDSAIAYHTNALQLQNLPPCLHPAMCIFTALHSDEVPLHAGCSLIDYDYQFN